MREIRNTLERNPEGLIIGFGAGYIWSTNIIDSHSIITMLVSSLVGAIFGVFIQNFIIKN